MYVERVPNRNSPPAILLRESFRDGGKTKKRTLANLSHWPEAKIEALRRVLREESAAMPEQAVRMLRSLPHGHVAAVLGIARKIGLDRLLAGQAPTGFPCHATAIRDTLPMHHIGEIVCPHILNLRCTRLEQTVRWRGRDHCGSITRSQLAVQIIERGFALIDIDNADMLLHRGHQRLPDLRPALPQIPVPQLV